ncbi:hypothetical protein [Hyperthermus butylicus]|uniref:Conserved archaeal protein n=1 Tax=Hyperthermus butylicus (strain DSM 5456 / JCM 9403 / PLM1-5) TaxID=415426 RepID=A2BKS0_HYPBU|nr:hypothetical protein [Hyperthermus butylicus]ABM80581.1 conserved archaeal protein [Hyperthermus butylicus DSM 5456]
MSDKIAEEEIAKNPKFIMFNLLRILKFFYSFKELEKMLNIPSQVLWRYTTLRVTPEKETAQKIIAKINELKLIEKAVSKTITGKWELWEIFRNPGILELAALKIVNEFKKNRIDVVLPAPDPYSIALGSIIAAYLRARLCIPVRMFPPGNSLVEVYMPAPNMLDVAAIPRSCIPRKSKVLIVAATTENQSLIEAAVNLALKSRAEIRGLFSLEGSRDAMRRMLAERGQNDSKILVLVEAAESA